MLKNNIKEFISQFATLKQAVIVGFGLSVLSITDNAHADFRKAIGAFQNQDGQAILSETREAVEQKNDDGVILFLSLLKEYPESWRPVLKPLEQDELFTLLEDLTEESGLQAQYHLAIIPRSHVAPRYNSPEALQEIQDLIQRLKPLANKGYSHAAFHLATITSNYPKDKLDQKNPLKWLIQSAELGHAVGAFFLGMRYLNIDDHFGCYVNSPMQCPEKDESKGWHWMQQAAMRIDKTDLLRAELAYQMGNLYRTGMDGQAADLAQAYLWYLTARQGLGAQSITPKVSSAIEDMQNSGQLRLVDLELSEAWSDKTRRYGILDSRKNWPKPSLLGIKNEKSKDSVPVFLFASMSWAESNQLLAVYEDGRVKLLITSAAWPDLKTATEIWKKINSRQVEEFMKAIEKLAFYRKFDDAGVSVCLIDSCPQITQNLIVVQRDGFERSAVIGNRWYGSYQPDLAQVLTIIEQFFSMRAFFCDASNGQDEKYCLPI